MRIGLMGGTFNPIHQGHMIISEYVREAMSLDKIIFIPSGNPPHKSKDELISADERYHMVGLSIKSNPYFDISSVERDREGFTYTLDTIKVFRKIYPEDELYFIIGADTLYALEQWKDFELVFKAVDFIAVGRTGIDESMIHDRIEELKDLYDAKITYISAPLIEISSTEIRERLLNNLSIKYLVEDNVEEYIHMNNLYAGK